MPALYVRTCVCVCVYACERGANKCPVCVGLFLTHSHTKCWAPLLTQIEKPPPLIWGALPVSCTEVGTACGNTHAHSRWRRISSCHTRLCVSLMQLGQAAPTWCDGFAQVDGVSCSLHYLSGIIQNNLSGNRQSKITP